MLDLMRKHAKSWVINLLIAAIAIVFVFWGVGSFRKQDVSKAATVNGRPISMADYQETYRRLLEMARSQYRDLLGDELLEALNLKQQALDQLINTTLIAQRAEAMGLGVTEEELQGDIAANPAFQVDGRFSPQQYQNMLSRYNFTPGEYEAQMDRELVSAKVTRLITESAHISEAEVRERFHFENDQVNLDFVVFTPDKFRGQVKLTPEELQDYFAKNKEAYRVPAKVKASYLVFRPKDYEDQVAVDNEEMVEYHELNLQNYEEPEQVKARHILFRLDPGASPEDEAKAKAKAEEVLAKAREGADFGALAQENSEDPTSSAGGDLGWFGRDQMVKPFSEAAFALKKGEISEPVRSEFGYHIIMLDDRRAARTRPFEEVKDEIRKKLAGEKAVEAAADAATRAYEAITLSQDFDGQAKKMDIKAYTTDFFTKDETLGQEGLDRSFNEAALTLKKGEISPLIDLENGHYLIRADDRVESYLPELEQVKIAVEEHLTQEKALEAAKAAARAFLDKVAKDGDWTKQVEESGLSVESTGLFTRQGRIPKIGANSDLDKNAFALKKVGAFGPQPYKGDNGYYVVRLAEKAAASEEAFAKEKEQLSERLLRRKEQMYLSDWLEAVREDSDISIEHGAL
ncbi:MAG: SurA N-terminal domain-containing protein [Pseudomonadota bacterium]